MDSIVKLVLAIVVGIIVIGLSILGVYKRKEIKTYCGKEARHGRKVARVGKLAAFHEKRAKKLRCKENNLNASKVKTAYL